MIEGIPAKMRLLQANVVMTVRPPASCQLAPNPATAAPASGELRARARVCRSAAGWQLLRACGRRALSGARDETRSDIWQRMNERTNEMAREVGVC